MTGVRCAEQPPAGVVSNQRGLLSPPPPPRCAQLVCAGSGLLHWLVPVLGAQLRSRDEERASKNSEHLPEMSQLQRAEDPPETRAAQVSPLQILTPKSRVV